MKIFALVLLVLAFSVIADAQAKSIPNPSIDMKGFLRSASDAAKHRETRRLT